MAEPEVHRHWTLETVFEADVPTWIGENIIIDVRAEVPMRGETRLPRRGNRYYPTTVRIGEEWDFHPADARAFAAQLIAAADAADAIDLPDSDPCGHWAPCDCGKGAA